MIRTIVGVIVVLLLLMAVKACFFPTRTHRPLRITAQVETPRGLLTGSSVIDFVYSSVPKWLPGSVGSSREVIGEAAVVDLGEGRFLLVLLHDQHWGRDLSNLLDERRREADGTVKKTWLPMLVTFKNANDATSIVEVAPDDLAAELGPGYSLRRITAVPTTDRPTFGQLNLIPAVRNQILSGTLEQPIAPPASLYAGDRTAKGLTRTAFQQSAPK